MDVKRKSILITGVIAGIAAVAFLGIQLNRLQIRNKIPVPSETANFSKAVKSQIDDAVAASKRNPSAANLGNLGMVYHSAALYNEAAQCYELAIQRKKTEWKWSYYNGYLSMEMGNADAAIQNFNEVVKLNPENYHAWYYLGEEYKNARKNELSENSYKKITGLRKKTSSIISTTRNDHFPLSTYASFKLSRLYFDTQRLDLAEETLKKLIQDEYLFGSAYRLLGTIYLSKGDPDLGTKYTHRANDLIAFTSPVDTLADRLALMSRSELYLLKKIDEAERSIHSDWALQLVNQGLKYMPENRDMISKAIKIYLWKEFNKEATALTDNHIKLFSGEYIEIKNTGMLFYQKALYEQAAKYWEKALELKQDELVVQLYLAKSLWAVGKKDKAQELLDQLAAKNMNNPDAIADVADLLYETGNQEKASDLLNRLKQQSPANPKVLRMQGEVAETGGNTGKAFALYEASLNGNPGDLKTIRHLGDILMSRENWGRYIEHYKKALEHHPNSPELLGRLGEALISCPDTNLRNVEKGKEYSERAFTCYNCPPDVMVSSGSHLAYAYALLGDKQKAVATITKTISIGRREKIAASSQEKLENFYRTLQAMNN